MSLKLLLTFLAGMILFSSLVFAMPQVPNSFYGTVTLNGQPAPDGTTVVAKIGGVQVASTTTSGGKYGYNPVFYVDDPNGDRTGKIVNFFVNGVDTGQTYIFANGKVTQLNLTAVSGGESGGDGGNGGGGGGGGGGVVLPPTNKTTEEEKEECQERWVCGDWSECVEEVQTRTCEDLNKCGTEEDKPLESQPCTTVETEIPAGETVPSTDHIPSSLTGMFALISNPVYALILVLFVMAFILTIFRSRISAFIKEKRKV